MDTPPELRKQLRPPFPRLRVMLQAMANDPRESLLIDDILIGMYFLLGPEEQAHAQNRASLTQMLSQSRKLGLVARVSRGRYAVTEAGKAKLLELL